MGPLPSPRSSTVRQVRKMTFLGGTYPPTCLSPCSLATPRAPVCHFGWKILAGLARWSSPRGGRCLPSRPSTLPAPHVESPASRSTSFFSFLSFLLQLSTALPRLRLTLAYNNALGASNGEHRNSNRTTEIIHGGLARRRLRITNHAFVLVGTYRLHRVQSVCQSVGGHISRRIGLAAPSRNTTSNRREALPCAFESRHRHRFLVSLPTHYEDETQPPTEKASALKDWTRFWWTSHAYSNTIRMLVPMSCCA